MRRILRPAMSAAFRFDPVKLPPECEALRAEVREFVAGELAMGLWVPNSDFGSHRSAAFSRRLGGRGWIGMTWPKRYGGGERSMLERYVVTEELLAAGAPVGAHWIADRQSAPLLLRYGTEEQRLAFLPGIAKGEIFSDPDLVAGICAWNRRSLAAGHRRRRLPQPLAPAGPAAIRAIAAVGADQGLREECRAARFAWNPSRAADSSPS